MGILELLIVVLVLAWVGGFLIMPIGGGLIHLLLVIALVVLLVRFVRREPL